MEADDEEPRGLEPAGFGRFAERYTGATWLRAFIAAIPYLGGPLDLLVSGVGSKIQQQRVESFLRDLDEEIRAIKGRQWPDLRQPSEELFDLFSVTMQGAMRTRAENQRRRFARVLARGAAEERWEDAEEATRLLNDLSDSHVLVLAEIAQAPVAGSPWDGMRVVTLLEPREGNNNDPKPPYLPALLPRILRATVLKICSDLVSRGLIHDEGIGRFGTSNMQYFRVTEFGEWFLEWIALAE